MIAGEAKSEVYKPQTVGVLNVISVIEMRILTYVFNTYDLAMQQAIELQKGITGPVEVFNETQTHNEMRQTIFRLKSSFELMTVNELEIAQEIIPVK